MWHNSLLFKNTSTFIFFIYENYWNSELLNRMGQVRHVECYAQGTALAAVWSPLLYDGGHASSSNTVPIVAIFSSFGAQLWCSLESSNDRFLFISYNISNLLGCVASPIAWLINGNERNKRLTCLFLEVMYIYNYDSSLSFIDGNLM